MSTQLLFKKTKAQIARDKRIKEGIRELKAVARRMQRRLKVLKNAK